MMGLRGLILETLILGQKVVLGLEIIVLQQKKLVMSIELKRKLLQNISI